VADQYGQHQGYQDLPMQFQESLPITCE
jgi:hypothetical protein